MWRLLTLSHVVPRTEMVFVLTYMDPKGEVKKTHLHLASFSPSSEVSCFTNKAQAKNCSVEGCPSEWSSPRNLRSTKSIGTIRATGGCLCSGTVLHFPIPGSASQASL
uniref:Uncharacterized protein FP13169 n=1 Tax=Homo sapiens TaxID=9606 RepID=Q71JB3_HUMAN|nr:unknown [Homo sapiens]